MLRRRMLYKQARLPAEYQEVEWIGSNGTQYINTGYALTSDNFKVEVDITRPLFEGKSILGSRGKSPDYYGVMLYSYSNYLRWWTGSGWWGAGYTPQVNVKEHHEFRCDGSNIYTKMMGEEISAAFVKTFVNGINIYLFANNTAGTLGFASTAQIHHYAISDNGIVKRELIPCYKISNVEIGMYDLAGGQFYTNQGTGTFTKGNDVN